MADRNTICFPRWGTQDVVKNGDKGFQQELGKWYSTAESKALEALIELKAKLRTTSNDEFWVVVVEGLSKVVGSELAFVMKRMLVDDQDAAVEMPPLGEPGSCLMAAALHYCTNTGDKQTVKQSKFHAYACPCAYMRHDRIFVIPEDLDGFITNNPNELPMAMDAYMAVPIFAQDKCIAHFGVMWTKQSSPVQRLSWAFVEAIMHSLEDIIGKKLVESGNFLKPKVQPVESPPQQIIPHGAVSVAQSLRPYAGSLSHELRTPMQGVVGMLDVMYATVQEAVQFQNDPELKKVFQNLKESIEVVQDSSRRAVVAADNVVHAYDMNMSIPESISTMRELVDPLDNNKQPGIVVAGQEIPLARESSKRRRTVDDEDDLANGTPHKQARVEASSWSRAAEASQEMRAGLQEAENFHPEDRDVRHAASRIAQQHGASHERQHSPSLQPTAVLRAANIRAVLQYVINEGLKTGGRPDYVNSTPTELGENIEVRSRGSDGSLSQKHIEWAVEQSIPRTMTFDEKDFSKLISCVVLNAIKFTDKMDGRISVRARIISRTRKCLSIKISDNGPGIPADFLPKLFQPFSQENGSITRQSDGLGLGLMVAKGIARKMGGELTCTKAETDAENHGCEFEIRLPMNPGDVISRSSSPCCSPILQRRGNDAHHFSPEAERLKSPPVTSAPRDEAEFVRRPSEIQRAGIVSNLDTINNIPNGTTSVSTTKRPSLNKLHHSNQGLSRANSHFGIDRELALKYPLQFLVAEDNKINRKLLVSMLSKLGYRNVLEAHDGLEAVRVMSAQTASHQVVDVVLMDLWMPGMDGYTATERILNAETNEPRPTVLAVTADVTDGALERAAQVGMRGFMSKPYKLQDLQRLITEYCLGRLDGESDGIDSDVGAEIPNVLSQTAVVA